jgi:integrase/recombinase XerD
MTGRRLPPPTDRSDDAAPPLIALDRALTPLGPGPTPPRQAPTNALRVSEACGADLCELALANGHRVVRIVGKGNQPALIPLAPRASRAIDAAVGERTDGPLLARADGSRLDRHAAGRIMRRLARRAGIDKPISPHSLRYAAITAALDAGCSLRDVQDFARHADPRQTRRYDRARGALDRNPTYIVATYVAGATGAR